MKEINICFASDDGYAMHLGVAIYSLIANLNKEYFANIFVLDGGISEDNKNKISESLEEFDNYNIIYLKINESKFLDFKTSYLSKEAYFRLEIPYIFPNINKILYIDIDIIVNGDISKIFEHNLGENMLGAIGEITSKYYYEQIAKIPNIIGYLNSGVLLMNLKKIRQENAFDKVIDYIKTNNEQMRSHDQEALNGVLYDKRVKLPPKFNALPFIFVSWNYKVLGYSKQEFEEAKNNPVIIHFAGEKPWNKYCWHPMKYKYFEYKNKTAFKNIQPQNKKQSFLNHLIYNIIIFLLANVPEKIYNLIYIFKKI